MCDLYHAGGLSLTLMQLRERLYVTSRTATVGETCGDWLSSCRVSPLGFISSGAALTCAVHDERAIVAVIVDERSDPPNTGRSVSGRMASYIRKRRWWLLGVWIVVLTTAALSAVTASGKLSGGGWSVPGSDSVAASDAMRTGFVGRGEVTVTLVVTDHRYTSGEPKFEQRVRDVLDTVRSDSGLGAREAFGWATLSPLNRAPFVGADKRSVVTSLGLNISEDDAEKQIPRVQQDLDAHYTDEGLDAKLVSAAAFRGSTGVVSKERLVRAELFTLPILAMVLLLLFRGVVAALVSFAVGATSVAVTLGLISPLASAVQVSVFVENVVTMLGLGIGIDYSLLVIKRFQEELARGDSATDAVARTLRSAGHAVVASGVTVVLALSTLVIVPLNAILSMAIGAIIVVAASVFAAVTVLPVLLSILGHRINGGTVPLPRWWRTEESGDDDAIRTRRWYRFIDQVMRRPVLGVLVTTAVLAGIALPATHVKISTPDARILPPTVSVRAGYDTIEHQFGTGAPSPIQVVVGAPVGFDRDDHGRVLSDLVDRLAATEGVAAVHSVMSVLPLVSPAEPFAALAPERFGSLPPDARQAIRYYLAQDDRTAIIEVVPTTRASDPATHALLDRIRAESATVPPGFAVRIGGETAEGAETNAVIDHNLPLVLALMLAIIRRIQLVVATPRFWRCVLAYGKRQIEVRAYRG
ncbi:MMPL family transporter, partial [Nocardia sp. NPDC051570]|uniref:MMPL family transporter n=1 Tax=Nocardia sp. NPDC051570 TaxID=3364324 RepID=UPI0037B358ED